MSNYSIFARQCEAVSQRIRALCKERGVTYADIADHLEISTATVQRYLRKVDKSDEDRDVAIPTLYFLVGVADLLGVEPDVFFLSRKGSSTLKEAIKPFRTAIRQNPDEMLRYFFQYLSDAFQ